MNRNAIKLLQTGGRFLVVVIHITIIMLISKKKHIPGTIISTPFCNLYICASTL